MAWELTYRLCGAGFTVAVAFAASPAVADRLALSTPEFPVETRAIVEATASLFDAAEAKGTPKPDVGTLTLSPLPTSAPVETAAGGLDAFDTSHGAVRHLTGYGLTWYPVDTLHGAVDFMGTWGNARNLVCGYVTWDVSSPDAPRMTDIVANYVDVSRIADASRHEQERVLLNANCAFGEIDPNFAVMN